VACEGAVSARRTGVVGESRKEHWHTPEAVLDLVRKLGPILFDPCSDRLSTVGAPWVCAPHDADEPAELRGPPEGSKLVSTDGFTAPWYVCGGLVFCNHPYARSKNARWARKAATEWLLALEDGNELYECVVLTPATPSAHWWRTYWDTAPAIAFWAGRIPFVDPLAKRTTGGDLGATFDSALIYFGRRLSAFAEIFEPECNRVLLFPSLLAAQMSWAKERRALASAQNRGAA
jgi:hypothetical protein